MDKSDLEFLELYLKSFTVLSANKTIAITRTDNKQFIFVSQSLLRLLKQGNLEGRRFRDIYQATPYINEYVELFNKLVQQGQAFGTLIAHDFDNNGIKSIKLLHKEPIISPLTGKVIAVVDELRDFVINREFAQFINLINLAAGGSTNLATNEAITLTKRQKEIVFLLSIGKSPKTIADFISRVENKILAPATVTAIINKHLYVKFGVGTTSQLIEKSILLGFVNNIPESFIRKSGVLMMLE